MGWLGGGVGVVIHHVFKQRRGRGTGVNDWPSLCGLSQLSVRIRLAAWGHLERRGHIAHIKGGPGV